MRTAADVDALTELAGLEKAALPVVLARRFTVARDADLA
jgi:hypothetical protein